MSPQTQTRADRNNNPTAMTIDVAKEGGLILGTDYQVGDPFEVEGRTFYTAKLLGDPVIPTIKVIDAIGFRIISDNVQRWSYISVPWFVWVGLPYQSKIDIVGAMYKFEGGVLMRSLFPNYASRSIF
jgi:hypothetical protein